MLLGWVTVVGLGVCAFVASTPGMGAARAVAPPPSAARSAPIATVRCSAPAATDWPRRGAHPGENAAEGGGQTRASALDPESLRVQVLDADGTPFHGARVSLVALAHESVSWWDDLPHQLRETMPLAILGNPDSGSPTGASGTVRVESLRLSGAPDRYELIVFAAPATWVRRTFRPRPPSSVTVTLPATGELEVRVVDLAGSSQGEGLSVRIFDYARATVRSGRIEGGLALFAGIPAGVVHWIEVGPSGNLRAAPLLTALPPHHRQTARIQVQLAR